MDSVRISPASQEYLNSLETWDSQFSDVITSARVKELCNL